MPHPQSRSVTIATSSILIVIAILTAVGVLWLIRDILLYLFVAVLLAGVMYPFAQWAAAHKIPKGVAVAFFYIILFGVLASVFSLLIPAIIDQSRTLASTFGDRASWIDSFTQSLRTFTEPSGGDWLQNVSSNVSGLEAQIQKVFGSALDFVAAIFGGIAGFFIVLVLSFYLVVEDSAIKDLFRHVVPPAYQDFCSQIAWGIIDKLGAWLRGQLVLGLIIGILYFIGFSIIGVPYALLLAILGGLLEFVPYVGPFLSAVPAVFFAFTVSPIRALVTMILILIIQRLENDVIVPKVMQKAVGLNPIISIVAFMIGAQLFGLVGAIFAIPIATAISVALTEIMRFRREEQEQG